LDATFAARQAAAAALAGGPEVECGGAWAEAPIGGTAGGGAAGGSAAGVGTIGSGMVCGGAAAGGRAVADAGIVARSGGLA